MAKAVFILPLKWREVVRANPVPPGDVISCANPAWRSRASTASSYGSSPPLRHSASAAKISKTEDDR
jgi:hypothetical protein